MATTPARGEPRARWAGISACLPGLYLPRCGGAVSRHRLFWAYTQLSGRQHARGEVFAFFG
jgi:hypothetical protein